MIVSKLITCGLLSLSPITKSTSQIAYLESKLSRDSPVYETFTIDNTNSNTDLKLVQYSNINQSIIETIDEQHFTNQNLLIELDSDKKYASYFAPILNNESNDPTEHNFCIEMSNYDGDYFYIYYDIDGTFNRVEGDYEESTESGLYIKSNSTFTYTGPGADILNQVFSNYTQGGNSMANILSAIGTALSTIGQWFVDLFGSMTAIFYDSTTGLTFVGTLLVVGLSCFLIALVINWVRGFVRI